VSERPHREPVRLLARGRLSVAVVLMLATALFVISAREARDPATRHPQDLAQLVESESERVEELTGRVDDLGGEVLRLTAESDAEAGTSPGAVPAGFTVESGSTPVEGPGLVVRLDDAPPDAVNADVSPDVLVVHQQDLQAVMNALWAGGAEAMTLMDQRVVSTSAVRCVGNVLRLHGRVYSPPYEIRVIGDPDALRAALDSSAAVRAYVRDSARVGLGWEVGVADELSLPAYTAPELDHARVPDGVEVLPGLADDPEHDEESR
jgi:uncharacterized protein YlxW (UPF0749 family)